MEYHIEEHDERERRSAKYPHAKEVFKLWGKYPFPWNLNASMRASAEWLYTEKGMEELTELFQWYAVHKDDEFCPKFHDPITLAQKYPQLEAHLERTK